MSESEGSSPERKDISASQQLSNLLKASRAQALSESKARALETQAWSVVPNLFQNLVSYRRPVLMECSEQASRVLQQVRADTKQDESVSHCATFNGCELATDAGVRLIMKRIAAEQPMHVWLRPPGGPFSPSQNRNQRSEEQSKVLREKRQQAIRTYIGATCIVHYALQKGIHVTLELSDRSEAWRLRVLSRLQSKYGLFQAVTKGCRVDLKDCEGRLVQKGWRVLTTHKRLAETLELPCRCQKGNSHGRSEQVEGSGMDYPDAYARRVSRVLLQELTFQDTMQECQGKSLLCEGFGEGEFCTCGEVNVPGKARTCPNCLQGRRAVPGNEDQGLVVVKDDVMKGMEGSRDTRLGILEEDGAMDDAGMLGSMRPEDQGNDGDMGDEGLMRTEAQGMYTESQIEAVEHQAAKLIQQKAFHHKACASLIRDLPLQEHARTRQALKTNRPRYLILGVYAYGNHYGITKWTRKLPQTCRYLWLYLQHWSPDPVTGSTLVVNDNCAVNIHRDHNNLPTSKNHIIGVTPFQQGELWLEGEPPNHHYKSCVKTLPNGQACSGHLRSVRQKVLTFDARQWHTTQPWQGDRVILGGYTSRGVRKVDESELQWLQQTGFPCKQDEQRQENEQSYVAQTSQAKRGTKIEEEIRRKLYLLHAATGHGSTRHMIDALRRRNVNPLVLRLAEEFVCPICAERKRVQPRQLASLEPLPPKFHTVVADIGHWRCPSSGEQQNFMLVIDEGSRFRVAKILSKGV